MANQRKPRRCNSLPMHNDFTSRLPFMRTKNYQHYAQDQDSIDIQGIVADTKPDQIFKKGKLCHFNMPRQGHNMNANNYQKDFNEQNTTILQNTSQKHIQRYKQKDPLQNLNKNQKTIKTSEISFKTKKTIRNQKTQSSLPRPQRKYKNNRRQTFPRDTLDNLIADFSQLQKPSPCICLHQMSLRYNLAPSYILLLQRQHSLDPSLLKYSNQNQAPMGALVNGIRQRTIQRIQVIGEMLEENPFLTQKQISDRLFQRDRGKKRVLRSAIIRMMRIAGWKKYRIRQAKNNTNAKQINQNRKQYVQKYRQKQSKGGYFYYLDQFLFHKHTYGDSFWSKSQEKIIPSPSKKFMEEGVVMIALLCPDGKILWQARQGNYTHQEYLQLIAKMLKKRHNGSNKVLIVGQLPLRPSDGIIQLSQKHKYDILKLPNDSQFLSPLQTLFLDLKQRAKRIFYESPKQAMPRICATLSQYNQNQMLGLIHRSQKILQRIQQGQLL